MMMGASGPSESKKKESSGDCTRKDYMWKGVIEGKGEKSAEKKSWRGRALPLSELGTERVNPIEA